MEQLKKQPHVEYLAQHVRGELILPGAGDQPSTAVNALFDSSSGVTSIYQTLVTQMQLKTPEK